jgi:flagella basal body P-ring formation protein FlgA
MRLLLLAAALSLASAAAAETTGLFLVPTVAIQTGDTITDEMIGERRLIANAVALRTHVTARDEVVGKVARRPIRAGAAIPLNALQMPQVFKEGERVTLEFRHGGISIRGAGVALQTGIAGKAVRVRNADTGTIVSGIAQADGSVAVGGGER